MDSLDLKRFDQLLAMAERVVSLEEVFHGDTANTTIGLRHDVDGNDESWEASLAMAKWEAARGYRSTYYFLHDTKYWGSQMRYQLHEMRALGHEIGLHNNAVAVGFREKKDPFEILCVAVEQLRSWSDHPVVSTAAHGDGDCRPGGFLNYQLFQESTNRNLGPGFKSAEELGIEPRPLADFGFEFQGDWLSRPHYMSDSGGSWTTYSTVPDITEVLPLYPFDDGMLMILQHPDWWPPGLYA